ncbi:hypothetical protein [Lacrimispora sp.]|uniref:hypothetical protein n=1 Tax=Lacrimispora sp. TaxID=2719234 RepID=UPI0034607ADE
MIDNKTRNQLKNMVSLKAAIAEAEEEVQMIQKEINIHGHDKKYVSALNELKQKIIYYRYRKIKICTNLYDKIEALEDEQEKRLLKYRYIRGYRWEIVADKMGYSIRQVFNIHNKIIYRIDH